MLLFARATLFLFSLLTFSVAHSESINVPSNGFTGQLVRVQFGSNFTVLDVNAVSAKAVPLSINIPREALSSDKKMWLRVIGLPENLKFSAGVIVNGIWFIPSQDAQKLSLVLPDKYTGSFKLDFFLMRDDRPVVSIVGKQTINVGIREKNLVKKDTPKTVITISKSEEKILLKRAEELMKLGTFAPARIIYEELANQGSAKGALELAKTYDPNLAKQNSVSGMEPDPVQARKWYKRAQELATKLN